MCGIAGIVSAETRDSLTSRIAAMTKSQVHRGPDGLGRWCGRVGESHVAFGFCRLAILDLTSAASQPMASPSMDGVLVYNGEVYNYQELRAELQNRGLNFTTR